jgi:predicted ATPase
MKKIVLSGGTYAGKTTLANLFKEHGFTTIPDSGLAVINELNLELGIKGQRDFRFNNPLEFYTRIIKKQLLLEEKHKDGIIVHDQGVFDYVAMMKIQTGKLHSLILKLVKETNYDIVISCEVLREFNTRPTTGRSLTEEQSKEFGRLAKEMYRENGSVIIEVKEMPILDRFKYIKNHLKAYS